MASATGAVWAIDIGNNSLKALCLTDVRGNVEVIGFDNVQHQKILTGGGISKAEREELVAISLRQFLRQNQIGSDEIIISVPSQNSFARFVTLPPVEEKKIPEIVKFEAAQQIPFDINEVQWDWQLMEKENGTEHRVGIFAIKNEVINATLDYFAREGLQVSYVQMSPMALYNYVLFDRPELCSSANQAVAILNIGAENSDLIVCTKNSVWQRCITMGGNSFTKAIADSFKLNFEKAEKLKRTAPMSKYARQILQAMKPVFTDLASEIQRSIGFYTTSNPGIKLNKVIALGGGVRMRGLLQYLQQSLQMPIESPDSFKKLTIGSDVSAAKFHDNVCDFGVVYGLALQGLGLAKIENNLLPKSTARSMEWAGKSKYFIAAACLLLGVSLLSFGRTLFDKIVYENNKSKRTQISAILSEAENAIKMVDEQRGRSAAYQQLIQKNFNLFKYRDVIPKLQETIISALPNAKNNKQQTDLYRAFEEGDVAGVKKFPRQQRKQLFITDMTVNYIGVLPDLAATATVKPGAATQPANTAEAVPSDSNLPNVEKGGPGFVVTFSGYSPYGNFRELIEPIGVTKDMEKWGLITRLEHLDKNSPFKLYGRDKGHFKLKFDDVAIGSSEMPYGVGIEREIPGVGAGTDLNKKATEQVLVDPMTKEVICKVPEVDQRGFVKKERGQVVYKVNDHWFKIEAKFVLQEPNQIQPQPGTVQNITEAR